MSSEAALAPQLVRVYPRKTPVRSSRLGSIWDGVDRLVDRSPGLRDLRVHGLQLFAARRWRRLGRPVLRELAEEELRHELVLHQVSSVLGEIRTATDGPVLVFKGPVAARFYPDASLRPFNDLDIVVAEPEALQTALVASGYRVLGHDDPDLHHLSTLLHPTLPLAIEVHRRLKWLPTLEPPSLEELVRTSEPYPGVEGVIAPGGPEHAVILAVHLWAHDPLTRLLRLIDVAVAASAVEESAIVAAATRLGVPRVWPASAALVDALLLETGRRSIPVSLWGRNAVRAREAAVWESHLGRCLAPLFVLPARKAVFGTAGALSQLARPEAGETWAAKLARIRRQVAHPSMRRTQALPWAGLDADDDR